jgi:hypothetical protein
LYFDDLVFVEGVGGKDNQWYRVTTAKGLQGWVPVASVTLNPPEPGAHLHRIQSGETPLGLVSRHYYKPKGLYSGDETPEVGDERFYVAALAFANKGRAGMPSAVDFEETSAWEETALIEGTHIWLPSKAFLNSLKEVVSSGSITGGTEELSKQVKEEAVYTAAFVAGLIYGALESIYDVFAGAVELIKMIWGTLESLFTGEIANDAQAFWKQLKSIDVSKLGEEFEKNWNNPDRWDSGFFRGRVVGYVIMELLMLYFSFGIATAIKWTGKFAKIGALIAKLEKVNDVIKAAQKLKMPNKVTALMKSKLGGKAEQKGAHILEEAEKGKKGEEVLETGLEQTRKEAVEESGKAVVEKSSKGVEGLYKVGKHGEMPSPRPGQHSHHGLLSAWMKKHYANYNPDKAPAVLMPEKMHIATFGVYNKWRAKMAKAMGGKFDWAKVTETEMYELSEQMFDAAKAPASIRQEYWQEFAKMKTALQKQ